MCRDHREVPGSAATPRITVVCNDADYFLRHRRIIADSLCRLGADVTVLTGGRDIRGIAAAWRAEHVRVERFGFHPVHDLRLALVTLADIARRRPEALYLVTLKPAVMCGLTAILTRAAFGRPRRVVVTLAGLGRLMAPGAPPTLSRRLTEWALRRMGRRNSFRFTFETEHDRNLCLAKRLVHPARSAVIDGAGVDPALFHPRAGDRAPGPLRILFASRLLRSKGLDAFLLAARQWDRPGEAEFLVAGFADDGDPDALAPETLAAEPRIRFLGAAGSMPDLLRSADVVCLPSRYGEGIPRILIEAAAAGVAAVASDLDGCRAIVEDGETGFLVPAGNAAASAAGIRSALEAYRADPALLRRHSAAGHRKFLSGGYSQDAVVERFMGLIAPEHRRPPGPADAVQEAGAAEG